MCALILAADLLFVGDQVEGALRQVVDAAGLEDCLILPAASHTHFAPASGPDKPVLGVSDELYVERYVEKTIGLVDRLISGPTTEAHIRYVAGEAAHSINRRRMGWAFAGGVVPHRTAVMRPNPDGPNDQTVHMLRFEDADGRLLATLWSYACHPVGFPTRHEVSAEFPGVVRRKLRERAASSSPVMFLQGFSGDLRPPSTLEAGRNPVRRLEYALSGPEFGSFSLSHYRRWTESLASIVVALSSSTSLSALRPSLDHRTRRVPLSTIIDGDVGQRELAMIQLKLSNDVQLFAVTAEVVVEFGAHLQRLFPGTRTIPIGCVGSVYGYLPTDRMVKDGGYEGSGFFEPFSLQGRFKPSVEAPIVELMSEFTR